MFCDNDIEFEQTNFEYAYNGMNQLIVTTLIYGLGITIGTWFVSDFYGMVMCFRKYRRKTNN